MTKKSFAHSNPAIAFISSAKIDEENENNNDLVIKNNVPMKRNPEFIETKSKRIQMLMQPSLYAQISKIAKKNKTSVNETMHEMLKKQIEIMNS